MLINLCFDDFKVKQAYKEWNQNKNVCEFSNKSESDTLRVCVKKMRVLQCMLLMLSVFFIEIAIVKCR